MVLSKKLTIFIFTVLTFTQFNEAFANPNTDLSELHTLYAKSLDQKGNEKSVTIKQMVILMKNILETNPDDAIVKENVLGVYKSAYANLPSHTLPADWHFPKELTHVRIAARRTDATSGETNYSLIVKGTLAVPGFIKQFQIIHYPNQIIFDKMAGLGKWDEYKTQQIKGNPVPPNLQIESNKMSQPYDTGLYILKLELQNGKKTEGWFILDDDMTPTTTPEVIKPAISETFATGNPTLKWLNYQSPQYKPYEKRILWVGISKIVKPDYDGVEQWHWYKEFPTIQQATLGKDGNFSNPKQHQLENGNYLFTLNYREMRYFGDIEMGRYASTVRGFKVQR